MNSAIVGRVLALGQAAVLLHAGFRDEFGVLVGDAVATFVVGLSVGVSPPVAQISALIELSTLVVIAVDGFVSDHSAGGCVVDCIVFGGIEEWRLQNSRWKVNGVGLGILISVDRGRRHAPFSSIERFANLLELAIHLEGCGPLYVGQMVVCGNLQSRVVAPVVGISDFVDLSG